MGSSSEEADTSGVRLREPRKCYVCKARFVELHTFYDQLCAPCAAFNWE